MPAGTKLYNNCTVTTLAGGAGGIGTSLAPGDLSLIVAAGTGALYPAVFPYPMTLGNPANGAAACEIVLATAKATDTFTVTRGQEGISAKTWAVGTSIIQDVTALTMNAVTSWYNVLLYGAKGDGVTDDTVAINAALTAAGAAFGGIVYLPATPSYYKISGTLTVPANVYLVGDGPTASPIQTTSATLDMIQITGAYSGVRNLGIWGTVGLRTAGAGINMTVAGYDVRIDQVNFTYMFNAIRMGNGTNIPNTVFLTNLDIHNTTNICIYSQSCANLYTANITCWNDVSVSNVYGFLWTSQQAVYMLNTTFFQMGTGVAIQPIAGANIAYGWFVNVSCDTCTTRGWLLDATNAGGAIVQTMELVNCWGATCTNEGFLAQAGSGTLRNISSYGFQAYNNGTNGMSFLIGCTQFDLQGTRAGGNSRTVNNTNAGIYVAGGCTSFSITGCRSGAVQGFGATQKYGIQLDTGASDTFNIIGNDVNGNSTAGFINNATGIHQHIASNLGYNPVGGNVGPAFPATTVASTNNTGVDVTAYVANGTSAITVIQIAGFAGTYVTTGLQIAASSWGTIRIPAGGSVKFTYAAGTPTWTWFAD